MPDLTSKSGIPRITGFRGPVVRRYAACGKPARARTNPVRPWNPTHEAGARLLGILPDGPTAFGPGHDSSGQVFSSRNTTNTGDVDGILGKIFY
jgi:hypothetical protein